MHEASLVRTLLNQVSDLLTEHRGDCVETIFIELGPLSGVEPLLVQSAFEQLAPESPVAGAKLVIQEIALGARCRQCHADFEIQRFQFLCPACGSRDVQVVSGDEFRLLSITIKQSLTDQASV